MDEEYHNTDNPIIGEVREKDQKSRESMMQGIFIEIPLWPNKQMTKEPEKVLSKLDNVEGFHV